MVYRQKTSITRKLLIHSVCCDNINTTALLTANTHGILDRWRVADGGNIFWKFFEPGFLKRCSGELPKSLVNPWSSSPSRGSCTVWCLERVTRIIFPYIFCPLRWLMAEKDKRFTQFSISIACCISHITLQTRKKKNTRKSKGRCTRIKNEVCWVFKDLHTCFSCWIHLGYCANFLEPNTIGFGILLIQQKLTDENMLSSPDFT